jgi:[ribosomal protein S5]-alanine N-acetyltransferase
MLLSQNGTVPRSTPVTSSAESAENIQHSEAVHRKHVTALSLRSAECLFPPKQSRNPSNATRCAMKLIMVARSRIATFARLREQFAREPNVRVMWDRRAQERRERTDDRVPERRTQERRRVVKPCDGQDCIVVHVTDDPMDAAENLTRSVCSASTMPEQPTDAMRELRMSSDQTNDWRKGVQPLTGNLVTVREVTATDAPTLFEALTDPRVTAHISPPPPTLRAFEGFIAWAQRERAIGNGVAFGIVPTGLQHAVGLIQVRSLEPTFFAAEWGFALSTSFWSTGVFQDAATLVIRFALDTLKVHRLEARAVSQNRRGNGALQKLGANAEAVLSKAFKRETHYDEQLLWSLVATEWKANAGVAGSTFVPAEVRTRVRAAVTEIRQHLQESRLSAAMEQAPPLYPFFVTDSRKTTRVCPTCGGIISADTCPKC